MMQRNSNRIEIDISIMRGQITSLQSQLAMQATVINSLSNIITRTSTLTDRILKDLEATSENVTSLVQQLIKLEREITSQQEEIDSMEANNNNLGKDFAELSTKVVMLKGHIENLSNAKMENIE